MDKFSVSIQAYHELSQQQPTLPRSYLIEACQQSLDDKWNVTRTPGECPGAELPFKVLLEKELRKNVSTKDNLLGIFIYLFIYFLFIHTNTFGLFTLI